MKPPVSFGEKRGRKGEAIQKKHSQLHPGENEKGKVDKVNIFCCLVKQEV